jgi:hypothetical protein
MPASARHEEMRSLCAVCALWLLAWPASAKKHEYHWKAGTINIFNVETERATPPQPPQPDSPPLQTTEVTYTYTIVGDEGTYTVKTSSKPFTRSGANVLYDVDKKTVHVNVSGDSKKLRIVDLQILKFSQK